MPIKSTVNAKNQIKTKCRMLFGQSVKIGKVYDGLQIIHANQKEINQKLEALLFEHGRLLLSSTDRKYFCIVSGDIAAHGKIIYAEYFITSINFNAPVTAETDAITLKDKYHFVPPKLIDFIKKGVTG